eukprot:TRINITY_DN6256_c0_g1_i1.p1 TRINITY_DN6256_c0_g1~~TRINITY_DN6256_c0_g1_i1.p1  ORF type:complete len:121 (+),score=10.84 TRINITY_DN6256_c0_g1_i1:104-466(+)
MCIRDSPMSVALLNSPVNGAFSIIAVSRSSKRLPTSRDSWYALNDMIPTLSCVRGSARRKLRKLLTSVDSFVSAISVSYTHLRAHETVLDLVCRLLLEKKKLYIIYRVINILYSNEFSTY